MQNNIATQTSMQHGTKWQEMLSLYSKYAALCWGFCIPLSTTLTTIFALFTLALIIASGNWREKITLIRNNPLAITIFILFLLFVIGCFYSIAPWHTRLRELIRFRELLSLPLILSVFIEEKWRRLGLLVLVIAMIIQLIGGTFIHFFISPEHTTITRDHISIGVMMAFLCFIFFHLALQNSGWKRGGCFILFAMTTIYLLMINTGRTGYLLFFVLLALSFIQIWQWRGLWMATGLCLILSLGAYHFSSTFHEQVSAALNHTQHYQITGENAQKGIHNKAAAVTSESLRLQWQKDSLAIIHAYPIFGAGTGAYLTATQQLFPHYDSRYITEKPHSDLLTIGSQLGMVGVLALLAVYLSHAYISLRIAKPYYFYAQLLLMTILVGGFFNSLFRDNVEKNFYIYMAALCMAQYSSRLNTYRDTGYVANKVP